MLFAIRVTPVPRPQFSPYNATDDWNPLERREAIAESVTALGLEGFQLVMDVFWESPKRRLVVLSNDATGEYAALLSNTFSGGRGALTLSITCEFGDGRELSVDDSSSSVLPASPQLTRWQLPMAHPPARLLRAFRYLLGRDFPGLHPTIRDVNLTIEERIRRSMVRETTHWIVAGYYAMDERTGTPFPTWSGAMRMIAVAAFPLGPLKRRGIRRKAEALLAEAERVPWEHHRTQPR